MRSSRTSAAITARRFEASHYCALCHDTDAGQDAANERPTYKTAPEAAFPARAAALWYQYYFHSERGRRGLTKDRRGIARQLWRMWSPTWGFDDATFERTAEAFDNPDFVEVVIHSYRHRYGLVPGDPAVAHIETRLTAQPPITVPAITIDGDADGVDPGTAHHAAKFAGPHEHRIFRQTGHNLPQERPKDWAQAVLDARAMSTA